MRLAFPNDDFERDDDIGPAARLVAMGREAVCPPSLPVNPRQKPKRNAATIATTTATASSIARTGSAMASPAEPMARFRASRALA